MTRTQTTRTIWDPALTRTALVDAIRKLNPRVMARNPVMFVVEIGSVFTTYLFFKNLGTASSSENGIAAPFANA